MKVKATRLGYYANIRIKEGQKFRLKNSKDFSEVWMEKLGKNEKVREEVVFEEPVIEESVLIEDAEDEQDEADNNSEVI